jgi:sucrose-phosphate synthase
VGLSILHLHLHGLLRGRNLELGRDPDTGGQTTYVLQLIRALAARPEVERVVVVTRLIHDRRLAVDYAQSDEPLTADASIVRLPFGPRRYLRKELLWPYLDELADLLVERLRQQDRLPDWIHAHYADAGYVGALVHRRLGIPLIYTGHSLGREKRRRLIQAGLDSSQIDAQYSMARRIDAEEITLAHSQLVVTSTQQEVEHQYCRYGRFCPERARVIPPGVNAELFHPPQAGQQEASIASLMAPFLRDPAKPPVLAICRPDPRKNIAALVEIFGRSELLRSQHNLVLVLGSRDDPRQLERQQREVLQQVFELVDRHDLYGRVAYPKQHQRSQIPAIYRWASRLGGVFVNPALTEPFGLTLLEAAASGLPVVATDDGGPCDILARTSNGLLVDVSDLDSLQQAVEESLRDPRRWRRWSHNGIEAVCRAFSWDAHVSHYLAEASKAIGDPSSRLAATVASGRSPYAAVDRPQKLVVLDLDGSFGAPDPGSLRELQSQLQSGSRIQLAVTSGRGIKSARRRYQELHLPEPLLWITQAGTDIHVGELRDHQWQQRIGRDWQRQAVVAAMAELEPRLQRQPESDQGPFKVSYLLTEADSGILPLVRQTLRSHDLRARPHLFQHWYLDVLPLVASKVEALRHAALHWNLPLGAILVEASQQGDAELLQGLPLGVVPQDHDPEFERLRQHRRVFFSTRPQAWGLLDGLRHHRFLRR